MATSKDYKNFILDQLSLLDDVVCKPMMGEYLLYYRGVLFGGIYDDRLLIKETKSNKRYELSEEIPYKGAKLMYQIDNIDDKEEIRSIIIDTYNDLK